MKEQYTFIKLIAWILFVVIFNLSGRAQHCTPKKITTYADTLAILTDYSNYLFSDAKPGVKNKLITFYQNGELMDTCYLFLVPDSQYEFTSDGDYISQFVHRSTIDKFPTAHWIEVAELLTDGDFYKLSLTINRKVQGTSEVMKTLHYRVKCRQEGKAYQFTRH